MDFIVNHIDCSIECKSSGRIANNHLKGLRELSLEHPELIRYTDGYAADDMMKLTDRSIPRYSIF